ncbi:MAG: pantetheine-phosphate adenylyltransferase [Clostridia bacterium]|nr:pantetheine-phosphate adenylyltransferase [Clostridia bacterium]
MITAIISGTFDPVTVGHVNIIRRAAELFPKVVVAVSVSHYKASLFGEKARVEALEAAVAGIKNVRVSRCRGLLADFCKKYKNPVIVRGARNGGDFEYEQEMYAVNSDIAGLESVILPAEPGLAHISSSYARELIKYGKPLKGVVPESALPVIENALNNEKH